MFFFPDSPFHIDIQSKKRAIAEGMASIFDIAGDVTSPYVEWCAYDGDFDTLASDYIIVINDYSKAVNKVAKRYKKKQ